NLVLWFTASVAVAGTILYAINLDGSRRKPIPGFANPRPAQEPLALQQARAGEAGRGRRATGPMQIPWHAWKDILARTYHNVEESRLVALAAGVTFYSLLALFPALAAGVSLYALFSDAGSIGKHLSLLADIVPANVLDLVGNEIMRIAGKSD